MGSFSAKLLSHRTRFTWASKSDLLPIRKITVFGLVRLRASVSQDERWLYVDLREKEMMGRNLKCKVSPPSDVVNKKSPSSTSVVWPCHSPKPLRLIDLLAEYCCVIDVRKVWVQIKADLSCPAVSQICSFIFCPDTWNTFGLTNWKPKKCLHLNDSRSKLHPDGVRTVSHD